MAVDPATIDQIRHDSRIDAARAAHIDIFDAGCVTQGRKAQPGCQSLGITFCGFAINKQAQPFFKAQAFKHGARAALLMQGLRHTGRIIALIGESIQKMFQRVVPMESMGGPIRIAKEIHTQASEGSYAGILMLAAFISLNLGLLNLLPIPVLDGGHIVFLIIEIIRGKPAPERLLEVTARVGLVLLLGLMFFATYNDISKWIQGTL